MWKILPVLSRMGKSYQKKDDVLRLQTDGLVYRNEIFFFHVERKKKTI